MARRFATRIRANRANRFARIDSQKKTYFHSVRAIRENRLKPAIRNFSPARNAIRKKKRAQFVGGSLVGVWNGWGYGIAFFRALNFQISEAEICPKNRSFCGISGIFLEHSASEKYFSDSEKWPFHTPPIHTPTKCRPSSGTLK